MESTPANLGVLTKPDTVDTKEGFEQWSLIARNKDSDHQLRHGYFITRLPSADERSVSWDEARVIEAKYYDAKWSKVPDVRTGIGQLTPFLTDQLYWMLKMK